MVRLIIDKQDNELYINVGDSNRILRSATIFKNGGIYEIQAYYVQGLQRKTFKQKTNPLDRKYKDLFKLVDEKHSSGFKYYFTKGKNWYINYYKH
jgi:hypothetical protein